MSSYPRARSVTAMLASLASVQRALPLAVSLGVALTAAPMLVARPAHACGCFAATNVASPVVQAGEKILFAKQNGMIVMQVQVEYSGQPSDFGWLLPLPAVSMTSAGVPGIEVGSQEVFDVLSRLTQPTYSLTTIPCGASRNGPTLGCGSSNALFGSVAEDAPGTLMPQTPLVKQSSVGPYEYAILKADNKTEMFGWLMANGYVVPAGTDGAVGPYIRPGGFFLALRLKAGQTAGDVQPVVLRYQSDLPAVPINLTSASATPNMGILIWVLGPARAIPRNYYSTVVDDAQLDWLNSVKNYADVVAKAVREIDGHHAFVTEFAGSSAPLSGALGTSTRYDFLDQQGLTRETDPVLFVQAILGTRSGSTQRFALNSQLTAILGAHIPLPAALIATQVSPSDYYSNLSFYLDTDRRQNPTKYADIAAALAAFDPVTLVKDLKERIVAPTLVAQTLFADPTLPKLTRLYTVMSPDDMNLDPAFSFNAELPDVPKDHQATLQSVCPKDGFPNAVLTTASGWKVEIPAASSNLNSYPTLGIPYAQRVEQLMDTGAAKVTLDNSDTIQKSLAAAGPGAQGCTALSDGRRRPTAGAGLMGLLSLGIGLLLLRRRPRPA